MELRHIRYFLVLAEELNFSRSAERLHITQPSLSRQIQELEKEIGAPLFYRTKRQVTLTNAGKVLVKKANEIIDLVDKQKFLHAYLQQGQKESFALDSQEPYRI